MYYKRRYVQFNNLVLDNYDMISTSPHRVDFKNNTQEYSFGHGVYVAHKTNYVFANAQDVSLTITLEMLRLPCEYRDYYKQFAVKEIIRPGKLWAVVNNDLIWAYAYATSMSESEDAVRDEYIINVDLTLPEGVWHKANKYATFLKPYDICTFFDCKGYEPPAPCPPLYEEDDPDCCLDCQARKADALANQETCMCCGSSIDKDMALCYTRNKLQMVYEECSPMFQIEYNCQKAGEFFDEMGEKICTKDSCSNVIAGRIYSDTEMPTTGVEIFIDGKVKDAQIEINGVKNVIEGEYDGLMIEADGDVYSVDECCKKLLSPAVWQLPTPNTHYGWTIRQGMNKVMIDRGSCCGKACAYIRVDSLTV